ncbi:hypothetical protein N9X40_02670 [bacterium]|nr:hypothetical protein [bacterium]
MQEYIQREDTYWKHVAKKAISDDRLAAWSIWTHVGGFDIHEEPNVLVVNTFTPEQFAKGMGGIWNFKKVFPDAKASDVLTRTISTTHDIAYYQNLEMNVKEQPQVIRINMAKADNVREYAEMETSLRGPFIDEQMKKGTTSVVSWSFSTLLMPRGSGSSHDAVSVDGYKSISDALNPGFADGVSLPEGIDKLFDIHDKVDIQLYQLASVVKLK